jgi:hypothetical protein
MDSALPLLVFLRVLYDLYVDFDGSLIEVEMTQHLFRVFQAIMHTS